MVFHARHYSKVIDICIIVVLPDFGVIRTSMCFGKDCRACTIIPSIETQPLVPGNRRIKITGKEHHSQKFISFKIRAEIVNNDYIQPPNDGLQSIKETDFFGSNGFCSLHFLAERSRDLSCAKWENCRRCSLL